MRHHLRGLGGFQGKDQTAFKGPVVHHMKTSVIHIRVTVAEKAELRRLAGEVPLGKYLRGRILEPRPDDSQACFRAETGGRSRSTAGDAGEEGDVRAWARAWVPLRAVRGTGKDCMDRP